MKSFVIALLVSIGWITMPSTVTVQGYDPGGSVGTYVMWWERVEESGNRVVIDGACISACTLVLGIVPLDRICLTDRASFGIHLATNTETGETDSEMTDIIVRSFYPKVVQDWIDEHRPLVKEPVFMLPEDFNGTIRKCDKEWQEEKEITKKNTETTEELPNKRNDVPKETPRDGKL